MNHQSGLKRAKDPILFLFLLLLLFIFHLVMLEGSSQSHAVDEPSESPGVAGKLLLQPLTTAPEFRVVDVESAGRRRLAPFQLCLACKCCVSAADPNTCATMPCCFGIDCQLPNKPFGVCAFVPKTCNCTSCAV